MGIGTVSRLVCEGSLCWSCLSLFRSAVIEIQCCACDGSFVFFCCWLCYWVVLLLEVAACCWDWLCPI